MLPYSPSPLFSAFALCHSSALSLSSDRISLDSSSLSLSHSGVTVWVQGMELRRESDDVEEEEGLLAKAGALQSLAHAPAHAHAISLSIHPSIYFLGLSVSVPRSLSLPLSGVTLNQN